MTTRYYVDMGKNDEWDLSFSYPVSNSYTWHALKIDRTEWDKIHCQIIDGSTVKFNAAIMGITMDDIPSFIAHNKYTHGMVRYKGVSEGWQFLLYGALTGQVLSWSGAHGHKVLGNIRDRKYGA